ncbi:MAG: fibronectin type III domain-containing protein [Chloroflexota bacterium]|nr:fibronectin type III domain-containing protein [Bacteroidales bacterium]HLO89813.1 fibronectin type III domain-containing protein [Lentimicrobium sp.]
MKLTTLSIIFVLTTFYSVHAQNLYTLSNAANPTNEANSTTGWSGAATITSSTTTPQNGTYSILITSNSSGGRDGRFTFTAVSGTVYNITIWARRGATFNSPAFANWTGLSGFATTNISTQTWTAYNFTVTATATNPVIAVYSAPIGAAAGNEVYIDNISITASGGGGGTDTQPPTAPTNLAASNIASTSLTLTWTASTDNVGVTNYRIYRNNNYLGQTGNATTTFNVTGLTASTTYSFYVRAADAAGNLSVTSNTINPTTTSGGGGGDTQPPTAPTSLAASNVGSSSLTLTWNASTDNVGVTNYQIFRNNTFFGQTGNATTTFNASGLASSTTYSFYVIAQDAAGNNSNQSNTINATTTAGSGGGGTPYTTENANLPTVNWQSLNYYAAGYVGIGTQPNSTYRLSVNGNIRAKEVVVESGWSDFVFDKDYELPPLHEVERFINENGHLKDIPSATEVQKNGIGLAEINTRLLQKVEELTLYIIEMNKKIEELENAQKTQSINQK